MSTTQSERYALEAKALLDEADAEGRHLTNDEKRKVNRLLEQAQRAKSVEYIEGNGSRATLAGDGSTIHGDLGAAFVASEGFKRISDSAGRGQQYTTGAVELDTKGTLLTGTGSPGSGSGGGLIPVPQVVPGVVETLFHSIEVPQLFGQQTTSGNTIRYIVEGTAISGAAGVAEGGEKPESELGYGVVDEPVKKLATSISTSDEILDDVPAVQQFVGGRLQAFVRIEEERQLLRGAGTNELVGLLDRGINLRGTVAEDGDVVHLLGRVIAETRGSSHLSPTGIIMSSRDWAAARLLRDENGQYHGSGAFGGAYSSVGGQSSGLFGQQLWGLPVALSASIGEGTAVVGNFAEAAAIHRRGGPVVEATNSHLGHFTQDLVALRCELREALAVYRPSAFTEVRGLTASGVL